MNNDGNKFIKLLKGWLEVMGETFFESFGDIEWENCLAEINNKLKEIFNKLI